ncbi:sodium/hydrogen exchanger 1-like isoform X3 [Humulus lupulus]|uniref:sodium/hydrogen exchanger 1-like isoform X3 n=1 Tax=Humulus lupulus TaxID=3486 RepID=UPI002B405FAA|nr:sodium/hydrogen exchanger 1-like isoform X3 [Humulus lupulus]
MTLLEAVPPLQLSSSSYLNSSTVIALTVFFALLCVCIIIGHLLEQNPWVNESITALLLGLCAGGVVLLVRKSESSRLLMFSEDLFFLYLLPPIIFNAGFQVKKKQFFKNFSTILLFGVFGTIISFCIITLGAFLLFKRIGISSLSVKDYLAVGAILSATDSVCTLQVLSQDQTPFLYSTVFGEGVVNDATSIVLFYSVQALDISNIDAGTVLKLLGTFLYLFFTSTALGVCAGLVSAYIIKTLYFGRHSTNREVALMMIMAYLSYMVAEKLSYSFMLVWMRWTLTNGKAAVQGTSIAVSATLFTLVLIGRAAFVFPIANIKNCVGGRDGSKIEFREQFIIWWAGLIRGAVTIALSYNQFADYKEKSTGDKALMITCTIIVVLFSTVVFGSITKPLIEAVMFRHSKPSTSDAAEAPSQEDLHQILLIEDGDSTDQGNNQPGLPKRSRLRLLISNPTTTVHYFWRKFDNRFMRPVFGGRGFVPFVPGSPTDAADQNS